MQLLIFALICLVSPTLQAKSGQSSAATRASTIDEAQRATNATSLVEKGPAITQSVRRLVHFLGRAIGMSKTNRQTCKDDKKKPQKCSLDCCVPHLANKMKTVTDVMGAYWQFEYTVKNEAWCQAENTECQCDQCIMSFKDRTKHIRDLPAKPMSTAKGKTTACTHLQIRSSAPDGCTAHYPRSYKNPAFFHYEEWAQDKTSFVYDTGKKELICGSKNGKTACCRWSPAPDQKDQKTNWAGTCCEFLHN